MARRPLKDKASVAKRSGPRFIEMAISSLRPWKGNPRRHPKAAIEALESSIKRFGVVAPVIVQSKTNRILAGHGRVIAAQAAGVTRMGVVVVDLDDADVVVAFAGDHPGGLVLLLLDAEVADAVLQDFAIARQA